MGCVVSMTILVTRAFAGGAQASRASPAATTSSVDRRIMVLSW
jgi:hypothetical protein